VARLRIACAALNAWRMEWLDFSKKPGAKKILPGSRQEGLDCGTARKISSA
jgi:hypothetical protein